MSVCLSVCVRVCVCTCVCMCVCVCVCVLGLGGVAFIFGSPSQALQAGLIKPIKVPGNQWCREPEGAGSGKSDDSCP